MSVFLSSGIPETFEAVNDLVKFVTMVIFTVTAQHAALNNGQVISFKTSLDQFGSRVVHMFYK